LKTVILDAMENEGNMLNTFGEAFNDKEEISYFKLKDMNILPCRSCGGCSYKSPGKCVAKDEIHEIFREIARCNTLIFLTPVRFGGYPSQLKKVVDKFMILALPTFTVRDGHLLHPSRYDSKLLIGIGIVKEGLRDQEESFKTLVENNALNLQYSHNSFIVRSSEQMKSIEEEIGSILKVVCQQ
jgi:multimeric flavodoxin WrbA